MMEYNVIERKKPVKALDTIYILDHKTLKVKPIERKLTPVKMLISRCDECITEACIGFMMEDYEINNESGTKKRSVIYTDKYKVRLDQEITVWLSVVREN
jgi:hypothetical protein